MFFFSKWNESFGKLLYRQQQLLLYFAGESIKIHHPMRQETRYEIASLHTLVVEMGGMSSSEGEYTNLVQLDGFHVEILL